MEKKNLRSGIVMDKVCEMTTKIGDEFNIVEFIFGLYLLWTGVLPDVDDCPPYTWRWDECTESVSFDIVCHSAIWEIESTKVIEIS